MALTMANLDERRNALGNVVGFDSTLLISSYCSLATNFVVSTAIVVYLWKAKKEAQRLLNDPTLKQAHVPYSRLIAVLTQSALPPLILGIAHMILLVAFGITFYTHGALWISFTVSGRSCIA